jgi:hypothetical protein
MGITNNLGRLSAGLTADASLNIGVGVTPSGTYKFEVGTTSKFTGVATFGSTLSNGTYTYTLPSATGTLALTSALSGYLPLTGGTLTGTLVTNTPLAINLNYAGSVNDIQLGAGTPLRIVNQAYSAVLFQVNNSGSVGINGTPSGTYGTLSVFGGLSIKDDNNAKLEIGRYNGSVTNSYIKLGTNSNSLRFTNATDAADLMTLTNSGNVGIGTTSPNVYTGFTNLQVNGTTNGLVQVTGSSSTIGSFYAGGGQGQIGTSSNHPFILFTNDVARLTLASTGAATFSSSVTAKNALESWSGASSANLFMKDLSGNNKYEMGWEATTNNFYIYSYGGGLTPFRISPSGNTLLGSPTDNSFKLQVLASGAPMMSLGTSSATGGYLEVRYNTSSVNGYLGAGNQLVTGGAVADMALTSNTGSVLFATNGGTERMRITSGGALQVKSGDSSEAISVYTNISTTDWAFRVGGSGIINGIATGSSSAATIMRMNKDSGSTRSLNAAGTLNASGADYAEYMIKAIDDIIAKGDVVGVNSNGLLTNVFIDSISFAVKSSDPSFVGNDTWGADLEIEALEAARIKVDRIAFSGQVPCNVLGANVGDYIIPIQLENGKIGGQAVTNPTFEQYQISVGKVWKIMEDGRAWIAVKIG